jgi:hypothetical protein
MVEGATPMPSMTVQKSLMRDKEAGNGRPEGELLRCPHCSQHFHSGGQVSPETNAEEFGREHDEEMGFADRTRQYDRDFDHYYAAGESSEAEPIKRRPQHFAEGGRVDGAGKVDGIHLHPSECSHLAAGGVCRHAPPRRHAGGEMGDDHVRNFAQGGEVDGVTFAGYLAKRRAARGLHRRKEF